jgi:hypothetical protein
MDTTVLDATALGGRRLSGQEPAAGGCPDGAAELTRNDSWRLSWRCGRVDRNPQLEAVLTVRQS